MIKATLAFDGVERGPGGPPTAFRIWRAGDNVTDHGPTFFTERSGALLLEEQARRVNRYSIDINHLSLDKTAPLENQRAVGWFSIDVRDGELWAVDVEWTLLVLDGLCKSPPEWRYHSPAYDVHPETGEVISLLNLALTNTPATWGVTALASRGTSPDTKEPRMRINATKWSALKAAIEGDDEDAKMAAYATLAGAFPDEDAADEKKDGADEPEKKDSVQAASDDADEKDSADDADEKDSRKASASAEASIIASQDARIRALEATIKRQAKADAEAERAAIIASRDVSKDLAAQLATLPLDAVRKLCSALPKRVVLAGAKLPVAGTRGQGQGGPAAAQHPEADNRPNLDERMGLKASSQSITHDGTKSYFPALTRDNAKSILAAQAAKKVS